MTSWFEKMIRDPCGKRDKTPQLFPSLPRPIADDPLPYKAIHCALAMTAALISPPQAARREPPRETTRHFLLALRLLRRDLGAAGNSPPRDSSVFVSTSLALHANLRGSTGESRVHLGGLRRILEVRPGGVAALCSGAPEVGNKVRRADVELALAAGTRTLFGYQVSPRPEAPYVCPGDHHERRRLAVPHPVGEASPAVQFAMADVLTLCNYSGQAQLSALHYQDLVLSITQRLVDLAPLGGNRPSQPLDDLCQLGLLAFMSTLLNEAGDRRRACSALISRLLRNRLDRDDIEIAYGRCPQLQLWLLFIYAVWAPELKQYCDADSFVARRIRVLASFLALGTWEDVTAYLRLYPWVAEFHDEPGTKVWAAACD